MPIISETAGYYRLHSDRELTSFAPWFGLLDDYRFLDGLPPVRKFGLNSQAKGLALTLHFGVDDDGVATPLGHHPKLSG